MYAVWTSYNKMLLEIVHRMQKRAARIILNALRIWRTVTLFNNLSWFPFYNEAYINRCALAFKRINGTLLHYLITSLTKSSDNHPKNTRNCNFNLLAPLQRKILREGTHLRSENCFWKTGITYLDP